MLEPRLRSASNPRRAARQIDDIVFLGELPGELDALGKRRVGRRRGEERVPVLGLLRQVVQPVRNVGKNPVDIENRE